MKIFTCEFMHEASTFAVGRTDFEVLTSLRWYEGQASIDALRGGSDYLSGFIQVAEENGVELIPSFATLNAGPTMKDETYEYFVQKIMSQIEDIKDEISGIVLALHGGGTNETVEDPEGELLRRIRKTVGYEMPISVTLDLHTNFSDLMNNNANLFISNKEYPHIDSREAGVKAMEYLLMMISGEIKPTSAFQRIPFLMVHDTFNGAPKKIKDIVKEYVKDKGLIDASFLHGFPYSDISISTPAIYVATDSDQELANKAATELAEIIWRYREEIQSHYLSPSEAIDAALEMEGDVILINEASDNPGAGTPGDGTHLLKVLLERNLAKTVFGYVYDPEAAMLAHTAGVGETIKLKIGGKTDHLHGEPLEVDAYVKCLTDGTFIATNPMIRGQHFTMGKSVRLVVGNVDVIIGSNRSQTFDDQVFLLHGIDFTKYKIIGLKSANHFRGFFEERVNAIISCDSPGASTLTWHYLDYKNIPRPIYPLDLNAEL